MKYEERNQEFIDLMDQIFDIQYSDPKKCFDLCLKLKEKAVKENNNYALCYAHNYIANSFYAYKSQDEIMTALDEALTINEKYQYDDLLIQIYNLYGIVVSNRYEFTDSIDYFLKGLKRAREVNSYRMIASININLADKFISLKHYRIALPYCGEGFNAYKRLSPEDAKKYEHIGLVAILNLAECYAHLNFEKEAIKLINEINVGKDETYYTLYLMGLSIKAIAYYQSKQYELCNKVINEVIAEGIENFYEREVLYLVYNNLLYVTIRLKDKEKCKLIIDILFNSDFVSNNVHFQKELIETMIQFYKEFEPDADYSDLYKQYYEINIQEEKKNNVFITNSIINKIKLYEETQLREKAVKQSDDIRRIADFDELTKISNRRTFNRKMKDYIGNSLIKKIGVIVFDLDCFKQYNDEYGHLLGDKLLVEFANCLCRNNDKILPCRFGGDEFISICIDCEEDDIKQYIEEVYFEFEKTQVNQNYIVTASAGYYNSTKHKGLVTNDIIVAADQQLYLVKNDQKNDYAGKSE